MGPALGLHRAAAGRVLHLIYPITQANCDTPPAVATLESSPQPLPCGERRTFVRAAVEVSYPDFRHFGYFCFGTKCARRTESWRPI
jgi:hypothetical protein